MNTAVISSIIGTVGAALIAVLTLHLRGLRDDIRAVGARIDGVESRLDSRLSRVEESLTRIETVQKEHGRKLDGLADHGERISALEGAVAAMS